MCMCVCVCEREREELPRTKESKKDVAWELGSGEENPIENIESTWFESLVLLELDGEGDVKRLNCCVIKRRKSFSKMFNFACRCKLGFESI